jgi:hypothetical protein
MQRRRFFAIDDAARTPLIEGLLERIQEQHVLERARRSGARRARPCVSNARAPPRVDDGASRRHPRPEDARRRPVASTYDHPNGVAFDQAVNLWVGFLDELVTSRRPKK